MKFLQRFICSVTACTVLISCIAFPLGSVADSSSPDDGTEFDFNEAVEEYCEDNGMEYLGDEDQYQALLQKLIAGEEFEEALSDVKEDDSFDFSLTAHASVDLNKVVEVVDDVTNTNYSGFNVFGVLNDALELGKKIFDVTYDQLAMEEFGTQYDVEIPTASELIGKTKIVYSSGTTELITLGVVYVRYYDGLFNMYLNKCQIYGLRQILVGNTNSISATYSFNVEEGSGLYPVPYSNAFMLSYGSLDNIKCMVKDDNNYYNVQTTSGGTRQTLCLSYQGGGTGTISTVGDSHYLYFVNLTKQAVTYYSVSGTTVLSDKDLYWNYGTIRYTISDWETNNYHEAISATSQSANTYSPSITYNNTYQAGDRITNNNYQDYGFYYDTDNNTWAYDTDYLTNYLTNYNSTVINNYYNTYQTIDQSGSTYGDTNNTQITVLAEQEEEETTQASEVPATTEATSYIIETGTDYMLEIDTYDIDYESYVSDPYGGLKQHYSELPSGTISAVQAFFSGIMNYIPASVLKLWFWVLLFSAAAWFVFRK